MTAEPAAMIPNTASCAHPPRSPDSAGSRPLLGAGITERSSWSTGRVVVDCAVARSGPDNEGAASESAATADGPPDPR